MNDTVYVSHQELKALAKEEGVMFDFPYISAGAIAAAMCVVSTVEGMRCYGTGQAQSLAHATDLAFDNAMIDLYGIPGRSCVEFEIMKAAKKAATETIALEAAEGAGKKAAGGVAAKKAAEEATAKKAAEEAAAKKAAEEAAARKAAEEAAAKKAAEEAAAKKAAEEVAARKAAEEAAAKKAAEEAAARKAAEETAAQKATENAASATHSTSYENDPDWIGCHSLTPEDPDDMVINYGPFKQTDEPSVLKPGPKYLSQVIKYRPDYIEKLVGLQPPTFMPRILQILGYCQRHGIGLHATSSQAHDILAQHGVKEL